MVLCVSLNQRTRVGIKAQNDTLVHGRPDTLETYRLSRQTNETGSKANDETLRQGVLKEMLQHGRDVDSIGTTSQWSTKQTTWVSTRQIRQRDTTEETSGVVGSTREDLQMEWQELTIVRSRCE